MNDYIGSAEITQMDEVELRSKYSQVFNALASKQHAAQEYNQMLDTLHKIERALYLRLMKL